MFVKDACRMFISPQLTSDTEILAATACSGASSTFSSAAEELAELRESFKRAQAPGRGTVSAGTVRESSMQIMQRL